MPSGSVFAQALGLPLWRRLMIGPFAGRVLSRHAHACNLIDAADQVVALVDPTVGPGPFSIVLGGAGELLAACAPGAPVALDRIALRLRAADCRLPLAAQMSEVALAGAAIWDAQLPACQAICHLPAGSVALLRAYTAWPAAGSTPLARTTAQALGAGAQALGAAIRRRAGYAEAARALAGLGQGLTPAGDDYLLGAMAALWLAGERGAAAELSQAGAHTTALSGALLAAAGQGDFMAPWHALARALDAADERATGAALGRIAATGASSGRDALAGFVGALGALGVS